MAGDLAVVTTARFDRLAKALARQHPEFAALLRTAVATLARDPRGGGRERGIRKLKGVAPGEGQYRLRLGRWRFRYDIDGRTVVLHHAGLRREDTYR